MYYLNKIIENMHLILHSISQSTKNINILLNKFLFNKINNFKCN